MTGILAAILALLLPWLLGIMALLGIWNFVSPRQTGQPGPIPIAAPVLLGYGYILGVYLASLVLRLWSLAGLRFDFSAILLMIGVMSLLAAYWTRHNLSTIQFSSQEGKVLGWQRLLFWALLGLLAIRFGGFFLELWWRPLLAWDAWWTYAAHARIWYESGSMVPIIPDSLWFANQEFAGYAYFPDRFSTIPLLQTWMALAWGSWDDSVINLPWLGCGIALCLAFYGQVRISGVTALMSLLLTYLLISIPLLGMHIALPGYMDLWVATTYAMAGMAFFLWVADSQPGQLALFVVSLIACILAKAPAFAWALTFVPGLLVYFWGRKALILVIASISVIFLGLMLGSTRILIELPFIGQLAIDSFSHSGEQAGDALASDLGQVSEEILNNLLLMGNWNVYGFVLLLLVPALPLLIWVRPISSESVVLLTGVAFILFTFWFTNKGIWAVDYTLFNRVVLHIVPLSLFYLVWIGQRSRLFGYFRAIPSAGPKQ